MTGVIAKLERGGLDNEPAGPFHEPAPIRPPTKFTICNDMQSRLCLRPHDIADNLILQLLELGIAHLIGGVAAEGLPERDRPQQAADVISPNGGRPSRAGIR